MDCIFIGTALAEQASANQLLKPECAADQKSSSTSFLACTTA